MSEGKPLNVLVAEALGWTDTKEVHYPTPFEDREPFWMGTAPKGLEAAMRVSHIDQANRAVTIHSGSIPRYDTDWSATGPLIEKYGITLYYAPLGWNGADYGQPWVVLSRAEGFRAGDNIKPRAMGVTPLIAVCRLILALHAAGKLPTEP